MRGKYTNQPHTTFHHHAKQNHLSSIGGTLADTLDDLISSRRIEPQLAIKIMTNFDQVIAQVLGEKVKARMSFKGHLDTYRFCDDVWTFILKDIKFKLDNSQTIEVDKVRIVSCMLIHWYTFLSSHRITDTFVT
jgi:transcription initiation factor TFIIA small subunit